MGLCGMTFALAAIRQFSTKRGCKHHIQFRLLPHFVSQQGLSPHHETAIQRKSSTINNIAINIYSFTSITRRTLQRNIYLFPYNIQIITQVQHNTFKYVKIFWEDEEKSSILLHL
jgi:hypothetical protein